MADGLDRERRQLRSVTSRTFSGTPRCTSSRWATRLPRRVDTPLFSRRPIRRTCAVSSMPASLAWRARLHPDWVTPPDPMPVLAEVGSLAYAPQTPFIAFHALLVGAAANDPAAIRAINVPGTTDAQATTLRLIGEGLIAFDGG